MDEIVIRKGRGLRRMIILLLSSGFAAAAIYVAFALINGNDAPLRALAKLTPSRMKVDRLARKAMSDDPAEQSAAEAAIAALSRRSDVKALVYHIVDDAKTDDERRRLCELLARAGAPAVQPLIEIHSRDLRRREPFYGKGLPLLAERRETRRDQSATVAFEALRLIGQPAVQAYAGMLKNGNPTDHMLALQGLEALKSPEAAAVLIAYAKAAPQSDMYGVIYALSEQENPLAAETFVAYIASYTDSAGNTNDAADVGIIGLARIQDARAVPGLLRLVSSKVSYYRIRSAQLLGVFGRPDVQKALIGALADDSYQVRAAAAESLGQMGDQSALTPLSSLSKDKMETVRVAAVTAIDRINARSKEPSTAK